MEFIVGQKYEKTARSIYSKGEIYIEFEVGDVLTKLEDDDSNCQNGTLNFEFNGTTITVPDCQPLRNSFKKLDGGI